MRLLRAQIVMIARWLEMRDALKNIHSVCISFIIAASLFLSAVANAVSVAETPTSTSDIRAANEAASDSILRLYLQCSERVWPGYDLKNLDILFLDGTTDEVLELSIAERKKKYRKINEFPEISSASAYGFFKHQNKLFMSINIKSYLGDSVKKLTTIEIQERIVRLALHEGFHATTQKTWTKKTRGARGTFVPVQYEPRLYRSMIYFRLMEALSQNSQVSLKKAKFWFEKWTSDFPHEVKSSMDRTEGSARYVDDRAWALIAAGGCVATEASVQEKLIEGLQKKSVPVLDGRVFSLDSEAYPLGSAALAVTKKYFSEANVFDQIALGSTSLEVLFQNVSAEADQAEQALVDRFKETQLTEQAEVSQALAPAYDAINSEEMVIISVPESWYRFGDTEGAISFIGFYLDFQKSLQFSVYDEEIISGSPDRGSILTAAPGTVSVLIENADVPCANAYEFYAVKRRELSFQNNKYVLKNKLLSGEFAAAEKKSRTQETFLCLGE